MQKIQELKGHIGAVHYLRFNYGGEYICSAGADRKIKIWNPKTGMCIKTYEGHGKDVFGLDV